MAQPSLTDGKVLYLGSLKKQRRIYVFLVYVENAYVRFSGCLISNEIFRIPLSAGTCILHALTIQAGWCGQRQLGVCGRH